MKLKDYIGQERIKTDIMVHIENSIKTSSPLEHSMFYGRPGLGKTTLVEVIADCLGRKLYQKTGEELTKLVLYDLLETIHFNQILFVDETHNIPVKTMELLYGPLQVINNLKLDQKEILPFDFQGIKVYPFTFMGATTAPGTITKPMRDRIVLSYEMQPYTLSELEKMLVLKGCKPDIAKLIAVRSRGTPRLALNYFMRMRNESSDISPDLCQTIFDRWQIDPTGFTVEDLRILEYIYKNEPVSESELYRTLGIDRKDYVNMYEPFLLERMMIRITSRGRTLTKEGRTYVLQSKP